jgi:hypothetical protein
MKSEELIYLIEISFHERSLSGGITQKLAWEIDDKRIPLAQGIVRDPKPDIVDDWRKVNSVDDSCFFDFDEKAWKYYLPAALRNAILVERDRILPSALAFFLLPTSANDGDGFDHQCWSPEKFVKTWGFNQLQAHCIAKVLEYLNAEYDDVEKQQLRKWIELYGRNG